MKLFWKLVTKFAFSLLSLRYRFEIKGLETLYRKDFPRQGGILFLPNHPAHMDPLFLFVLLWADFRMRPVVTEYIYRMSFIKPLMKLCKGLPIPSFTTSINQMKVKKAKESIQAVADGLKEGKNFILYPAGRLKHSGAEVVGGSSGAHEIIQQSPEANVVLIRTTGLWGSSFSRAILGVSPDLPKTLFDGIKVLLKNGIFFAPKRTVTIEIEIEPQGLPRNGTRIEFNRFLENWYNQYPDAKGMIRKEESLTLISYAFWKKDLPKIIAPHAEKSLLSNVSISPETEEKIIKEIRRILASPDLSITPNMRLTMDLGMDSLNIADIISFLAQKFDLEEVHPEDIDTVLDLFKLAESAKTIKNKTKKLGTTSFPLEKERPAPSFPEGKTIQESFLLICQKMNDHIACGDDVSGVMSYKKLKRSALILSSYFQKIPESHVAVLLPASTGAYLVIFALLLANKVPVMLNWTLGPRYLDEMMRISNAKTAISSWRFLEKLSHVDFGSLIDDLDLLEDIRSRIGIIDKLKGLFLSFRSPRAILNCLGLKNKDENDPAVILFTSGTESVPKGVPLSHKNLISNQQDTVQCIDLAPDDVLYSILPPFHSFGFSIAGTLPILAGMRVAFFPDPTDSFALAQGVERWKITFFCGAPNFLKGLFYTAKPEQLKTVRLFVSGAEKAPKDLYDFVKNLGTNAILTEGYGITECSPVISLNRLNLPPKGVGHLLPDIEMCTIHLETSALLPKGEEGEICIRGPNVFQGYLENPRSPFIEINGQKWYRTGDIGYLDPEGYLILSGRIKRFTKLGGEMISLGAIEEVLTAELVKKKGSIPEGPILAVCVDEKKVKPEIIVFTTESLTREAANELLIESGFSRLIKISRVQKVTEIPLLGTGKTNYRQLQTLI
jgi:long-chain-fatty-acid--[acyl-carrier-protein] ligase